MMRLARNILCFILIFNMTFPAATFAGTHGTTQSAVILPIVQDNDGVAAEFANELSNALAKELGAQVNTIDFKTFMQSNQGVDTQKLSNSFLTLFKRLSGAKERYSLEGDWQSAIQELDRLSEDLLNQSNFNQEAARIYESAQLSKAWILFQTGKQKAAADTIQIVASAKAAHKINTDGYPGAFERFIRNELKKASYTEATLSLDTKPRSVDVFVNGIYAGDSSMPLTVPSGRSLIHLSAPGRRTVRQTINLGNGEQKFLKSSLSWSRKGWQSEIGVSPKDPFGDLSLSTAVNQGMHADKVVFLNVRSAKSGFQIAVRVYDQNFHQPLATIQYPKVVRDIKKESLKLHQYLSDHLKPYLSKPANKLWKGDYDRKIILDDRIASRPREPLYRKPAFWAVVGGVVITGVALGLALSNGGSSSGAGDGSVVVDISGFKGALR